MVNLGKKNMSLYSREVFKYETEGHYLGSRTFIHLDKNLKYDASMQKKERKGDSKSRTMSLILLGLSHSSIQYFFPRHRDHISPFEF